MKSINLWRFILVVASILAVLWLQAPRLVDDFRVDQDFRTFYWMNKFQDPALFPDDPLNFSAYITVEMFGQEWVLMPRSLGYGLLFYIASFFVKPVLFSKLIAFILLPITVLYLFEFGQAARNRQSGLALAFTFMLLSLASPSSSSIIPGLQRSFAASLMIALIYYLQRQKYVGAVVVILLSALIYPPMLVLGAMTWGLFALKISWPPRITISSVVQRGIGHFLIASFLSVLIVIPALLVSFPNFFASATNGSVENVGALSDPANTSTKTYKYIWYNPKYQTGGQTPLFFFFPLVGRGGLVNNGEDAVHLLVLLCLSGLILWVRGRRAFRLPFVMWCLLGASLIGFVLAWLMVLATNSFLFYLPSRYTRIGLLLYLLVFVIWNGKEAATEAMFAMRRSPQRLSWLIAAVGLLVLGLTLLYPSEWSKINNFNMKWLLVPAGILFTTLAVVVIRRPPTTSSTPFKLGHVRGGRFLMGLVVAGIVVGWAAYAPIVSAVDFLDPPPEERQLLDFLETLPKDVLLAGTPCALDNVPLFARRQVVFNCDLVGKNTMLIRRALNAYYTDNPQVVADLCQLHQIDYLVVDSRVYTKEFLADGVIFFEPYNQELLPYVEQQETFVLAELPDEAKIFQSGDYFVVPCDAFDAG